MYILGFSDYWELYYIYVLFLLLSEDPSSYPQKKQKKEGDQERWKIGILI